MIRFDRLAERSGAAQIAIIGAIGTAAPLLGTVFVTGIGEILLVATALSSALGSGWIWQRRRALLSLPLEIGAHAIRAEVDGGQVARVRVRLGRGRVVREVQIQATLQPEQGPPRQLRVELPADQMCGAWTVSLRDPQGSSWPDGALQVRVEVQEGERRWSAERTFSEVTDDRFVPPLRRIRGRVELEREAWDALLPRALPTPPG